LIFAFQLCLWQNSARQKTQLGKKLKLRSLIGLRFLIPVFFYFFMASTLMIRPATYAEMSPYSRCGIPASWQHSRSHLRPPSDVVRKKLPCLPTKYPAYCRIAAGFIVQWMLNYLLLLSLGLALETMLSVLTQAFLPFFLIL
jgi:hypothetical protein